MSNYEHGYVVRIARTDVIHFVNVLLKRGYQISQELYNSLIGFSHNGILYDVAQFEENTDESSLPHIIKRDENYILHVEIYKEIQGIFDKSGDELTIIIMSYGSTEITDRHNPYFVEINNLLKSIKLIHAYISRYDAIINSVQYNEEFLVDYKKNPNHITIMEHTYFGEKYISQIGLQKIVNCPAYEINVTNFGRQISINCRMVGNTVMSQEFEGWRDELYRDRLEEWLKVNTYFNPPNNR